MYLCRPIFDNSMLIRACWLSEKISGIFFDYRTVCEHSVVNMRDTLEYSLVVVISIVLLVGVSPIGCIPVTPPHVSLLLLAASFLSKSKPYIMATEPIA